MELGVVQASEGFNPTLVRLRRGKKRGTTPRVAEFQSHAGSIEAGLHPHRGPGPPLFQSHAGSIEAHSNHTTAKILIPLFQSHAGSIEA